MQYIYVCITHKCHVDDIELIKKTIKYKKAKQLAEIFEISDDRIIIDSCTSRNRHKSGLERILAEKNNTIIISDLTSLGKKEEIAAVYERIIQSENELIITYFGSSGILEFDRELSTVNLSFNPVDFALPMPKRLEKINSLSDFKYKSVSQKTFIDISEAYWKIEKGEALQKDILEDLGISKKTFAKRVDEYIGSDEWIDRYYPELKENDSFINTPCKLGGISDYAKRLNDYLSENENILESYDIDVIVFSDLFFNIPYDAFYNQDDVSLSPEEREYSKRKAFVYASHLYRQSLKYKNYLYQLKYRKK